MAAQVAPEQLYQGGAAVGVSCCSCGATTTSGSWRKGWIAPGSELAVNLCNRCGQRWAKCGRPTLQPGQELVPRRPPVGGSGGARGGGSAAVRVAASRAAVAVGKNASHAGVAGVLISARAGQADAAAFGGAARGGEALAPATSATGGACSSPSGRPGPASALSALPTPASPLWTHERVSRGRAQHVLFWVHEGVDVADCRLACVGTDTRSSGHYVYASVPGFRGPADDPAADAPALSATNRADVAAWLAERGVRLAPADARLAAPDGVERLERAVAEGLVSLPQQTRDGSRPLDLPGYGPAEAQAPGVYGPFEGAPHTNAYGPLERAPRPSVCGLPAHEVSFPGSSSRFSYASGYHPTAAPGEVPFDRAAGPSPDVAWNRAGGPGGYGGSPVGTRGELHSPQRHAYAAYPSVPSPEASGYDPSVAPEPELSRSRGGPGGQGSQDFTAAYYPYAHGPGAARLGTEASFTHPHLHPHLGGGYASCSPGRFPSASSAPQALTQQASVSSVGSHVPQQPSTPAGGLVPRTFPDAPVFVSCREADEWTFDGRRRRAIYLVLSDGSERLAATIRERDPAADGASAHAPQQQHGAATSLVVQATPEMGGVVFGAPDELARWIRSAMGKRPPQTPVGVVDARSGTGGYLAGLGDPLFGGYGDAEGRAGRSAAAEVELGERSPEHGAERAQAHVLTPPGGESPSVPAFAHPVPPPCKGGKLRPRWVGGRDAASRDASLDDVDSPQIISAGKPRVSAGKPSPAALTLAPTSHVFHVSSAFAGVFPDSPCEHPLASPSTILTARGDGAASGAPGAAVPDGFAGAETPDGAACGARASRASPAPPSAGAAAAGLEDATSLSHLACGRRLSTPQAFLLSPRALLSPNETLDSPQSYGLLSGFGADVFGAADIEAFEAFEGASDAARASVERGSPMPGADDHHASAFSLVHGTASLRASSLRPAGLFSRPESRLTPQAQAGESRLPTPLASDSRFATPPSEGLRYTPLSRHASVELPHPDAHLDSARRLGISLTPRLSGDAQSLLLDECAPAMAAGSPASASYAPSRLGDGGGSGGAAGLSPSADQPRPANGAPDGARALGAPCEKRESEAAAGDAAAGGDPRLAAAGAPAALSKSPKRPRRSSTSEAPEPSPVLAEPSCPGEPRTPGAASRLSRHRNSSEDGGEAEERDDEMQGSARAPDAACATASPAKLDAAHVPARESLPSARSSGSVAAAHPPSAAAALTKLQPSAQTAAAQPQFASEALSATAWALRLDAISSSASPPGPLLAALSSLAEAPLPLPSIEASGLAVRVAALRRHANPQVAAAALAVSARWRSRALGALKAARDHATGAPAKSLRAPRQRVQGGAHSVPEAAGAQPPGGALASSSASPQASPQAPSRVVGAC